MLKNLPFKPGIYEEASDRDVGKLGYWKDCDKVRFRDGLPQKIGGWAVNDFLGGATFLGIARGAVDWVNNERTEKYVGFGTNAKLYLVRQAQPDELYDITPVEQSYNLTDPFSTTIGSNVVNVTHASHGREAGVYVEFSGTDVAVGGIPAAELDDNFEIKTVVDADNYTIEVTTVATSTTTTIGGSVTASYEPLMGGDSTGSLGYGSQTYSSGTYGTPRTAPTGTLQQVTASTWSLDTWGEDLIACPFGGRIYVWDQSAGYSTRATIISAAPLENLAAFVSTEDRHLVALGCTPAGGGDINPMLIRWSNQEDYDTWTPAVNNTAGDKVLDVGTKIVGYSKVRGTTLIFTNTFLYSMQFVGPPYTYDFAPLGDNGGVRGPLCVAAYEGVAYWIGEKEFYYYDGSVKVLPCTVKERIFSDINSGQNEKVCAGVNRAYNEVWWFYPSAGATENDLYVVYNIIDKAWYYGEMSRTTYIGNSDVLDYPYAFGADGYIYEHEFGTDADGAALEAYIESGDIELDPEGNQFQHLSKYIPDFRRLIGGVSVTFTGRRYPQDSAQIISGPHEVSSSTKFVNPRMRCRQMSIKIESDGVGDDWRASSLRIDTVPHGRR